MEETGSEQQGINISEVSINGIKEEVIMIPSTSSSSFKSSPIDSTAEDTPQESTKNWTKKKVKRLLKLYEENSLQFSGQRYIKRDGWQKICDALNREGGQQFNAKEVTKKWRNMKDRYKKIRSSNSLIGRGNSRWIFFQDMEHLLSRDAAMNPPVIMDNAGSPYIGEVPQRIDASQSPNPSTSSSTPLLSMPVTYLKQQEPPGWAKVFIKDMKKDNRKLRKSLRKLAKQYKRRNDLFEKFFDIIKSAQ